MESFKAKLAFGSGTAAGWIGHDLIGGGLFRLGVVALAGLVAVTALRSRTPTTTKD